MAHFFQIYTRILWWLYNNLPKMVAFKDIWTSKIHYCLNWNIITNFKIIRAKCLS